MYYGIKVGERHRGGRDPELCGNAVKVLSVPKLEAFRVAGPTSLRSENTKRHKRDGGEGQVHLGKGTPDEGSVKAKALCQACAWVFPREAKRVVGKGVEGVRRSMRVSDP